MYSKEMYEIARLIFKEDDLVDEVLSVNLFPHSEPRPFLDDVYDLIEEVIIECRED